MTSSVTKSSPLMSMMLCKQTAMQSMAYLISLSLLVILKKLPNILWKFNVFCMFPFAISFVIDVWSGNVSRTRHEVVFT